MRVENSRRHFQLCLYSWPHQRNQPLHRALYYHSLHYLAASLLPHSSRSQGLRRPPTFASTIAASFGSPNCLPIHSFCQYRCRLYSFCNRNDSGITLVQPSTKSWLFSLTILRMEHKVYEFVPTSGLQWVDRTIFGPHLANAHSSEHL